MTPALIGQPCDRAYDFEPKSSGDGRTMEGYVAVFGASARISDRNGNFDEEIHPGVFDRYLRDRGAPVMQFDHGKDTRVGSVPIGVYEVFEPDSKGYFVRGRLLDNPVVEPVRQAIAAGALRGMSFRFMVRDDAGQRWTRRPGGVDKRDVLDADVPEAGPVVFPAYSSTSVNVRSLIRHLDADEARDIFRELAAQAGLATDLNFTGQPVARSAGGGESGVEPWEGETPSTTTPAAARLRALSLRRPSLR
jgi:HK97 family phage prohead protease